MRIRMRVSVTGTFHNIDGGVERGQIVDVDEATAHRYIKNGIAEPFPGDDEEGAVLKPEVETATVKRAPRRPKEPPAEWHDTQAPGWKDANPDQ